MSEFVSEEEFKKKETKFIIFGIILIILGFGCFFGGFTLAILTSKFYLFFISFIGPMMFVPGFILISLGTQRRLAKFQAQCMGPISVEAAKMYGKNVAKEMASGAKEGFDDEIKEVICKYCGNIIDEDSQFCKYCGKKL